MRLLFLLFFSLLHIRLERLFMKPPPPPRLIQSKQKLFVDFTRVCPFSGHLVFIAFTKQVWYNYLSSPQLWFGRFFSRAVRGNNVCKNFPPRRISDLLNECYAVKCGSQKCCICVSLSQTSPLPLADSIRHIITISKHFSEELLRSIRPRFILSTELSHPDLWCPPPSARYSEGFHNPYRQRQTVCWCAVDRGTGVFWNHRYHQRGS